MTKKLKLTELLHGGDYNPDQWLDHPEVIKKDFQLFKEANINTVTVDTFSWATLEPNEGEYHFEWLDDIFDRVEAQNGHVILATPSGARPRWLAEKYPEVLRVNEKGERALFGERQNHCYTSPVYREKVQTINRKLAERYGQRKGLLMWHISNEFGGECHCELCQAAFRDWLKNKYQTLDNLNHAYWSGFWAHKYTNWNQIHSPSSEGDYTFLGLNLDWKRFVTERTVSFFDMEVEPLHEITPKILVTTNFMGGNPAESHVFYDLDYQKFAKHVDVISWDSYPNWANDYESTAELAMKTGLMNDVMRSLKHQNYLIMESTPSQVNWHPFNRSKRPGMHEMGSLQQIAHGADSVMYFQLHQSRGASEMYHGAVITHNMSDQTRAFKDVRQVGNDLKQLKKITGTSRQTAKVGIVFDYDNMWALDDSRNYANKTKKYWRTIQDQYRYFWQQDIPVEILSVDDDLTPYTLIIDPMHFMMSKNFATKLQDYVRQGGHLVGTYITGMVDKDFLAYLGGWPSKLHDTYGIEFTETDTLYPTQHNHIKYRDEVFESKDYCDLFSLDSAKPIATYQDDFYAGDPAVTENKLGTGKAYYLGARTDADFLNAFYSQLSKELDLLNTIAVTKQTSTINVQVREDEINRYYFVINYSHKKAEVLITKDLMDEFTNQPVRPSTQTINGYGVKVYSEMK
ncbi:MAG TPA: beta-galactosidase [Lactobacillus sp.]|nr:beta-galactosidase [Lactobacillus sp.]